VLSSSTQESEIAASEKPTIVFAHGLWADGSCWSEIITRLHAEGFSAIAVQNPLTSLEDDVSAVRRALDRAGGPVISSAILGAAL
jgi:hypothetical protein